MEKQEFVSGLVQRLLGADVLEVTSPSSVILEGEIGRFYDALKSKGAKVDRELASAVYSLCHFSHTVQLTERKVSQICGVPEKNLLSYKFP